jgi:transposase
MIPLHSNCSMLRCKLQSLEQHIHDCCCHEYEQSCAITVFTVSTCSFFKASLKSFLFMKPVLLMSNMLNAAITSIPRCLIEHRTHQENDNAHMLSMMCIAYSTRHEHSVARYTCYARHASSNTTLYIALYIAL